MPVGLRGLTVPRLGELAKHVGADVVLERPVTNVEIVAQVDALVAMVARYRVEPSEEASAPSIAAAAARASTNAGGLR